MRERKVRKVKGRQGLSEVGEEYTRRRALSMLPASCSALFHYPLSIQDSSMME